MNGSGNKPPWVVPAKATQGLLDMKRAERYFELPGLNKPDIFPIMSVRVWSQLGGWCVHVHIQC